MSILLKIHLNKLKYNMIMWNSISNSIQTSQDYYDADFYKNKQLIRNIYFYFKNNGFKNIILTQIINIIISIFIYFFIVFLYNCIDYHQLFTLQEYTYVTDVIKIRDFKNFNFIILVFTIVFGIFSITKIFNVIENFRKYTRIKNYYKQLEIDDDKLKFMSWSEIVNSISSYNNEDIDICYINNIILFKENFLISLFNTNLIKISHLTNLMEWNILYCIIHKLFLEKDGMKDIEITKKDIKSRLRFISIINFIFMPFILTFMLFYNVFNYGEHFYNKPSELISRKFTKKALWKFRNYNELDHEFNERINKLHEPSNQYLSLFKKVHISVFVKLFVFIFSSLFTILIVFSLINDKILLYVLITKGKSVLWLLGILGSLITILKSDNNNVKQLEPKTFMIKIADYVFIDDNFIENSNEKENYEKYKKLYQYRIFLIIKDLVYTILTPFKLWIISFDSDRIVDYITDITIKHNKLGYICLHSDFSTELLNHLNQEDFKTSSKIHLSLYQFTERYNDWYKYMMNKLNNNINSININVI